MSDGTGIFDAEGDSITAIPPGAPNRWQTQVLHYCLQGPNAMDVQTIYLKPQANLSMRFIDIIMEQNEENSTLNGF